MRNLSSSSSKIRKHHYRWVNFQAAALALHECLQTAALSASFSYLTWGNGPYRSKAAQRGLQERSSEAVARSAAAEALNILQHPCNPSCMLCPKFSPSSTANPSCVWSRCHRRGSLASWWLPQQGSCRRGWNILLQGTLCSLVYQTACSSWCLHV